MGNHGYVQAGEVQRMTAGKGVQHSESNASKDRPLRLLQIWVYPKERDLPPSYEQKILDPENLKNTLFPVVSGEPSETALLIHQDATFYMGHFDKGKAISHKLLSKKHGVYLFVIEGSIALGDKTLGASDSAQITKTEQIEIQALKNTKILLIEVGVNTL